MRFPESISRKEYEQITQRSLRLFLSVDIVNSTALKEEYREKGQSWLEIAHSFYTKFPSMLASALDPNPRMFVSTPEVNPWKAIGDELVFVARIEVMDEIPRLVDAFRSVSNRWNRDYEKSEVVVKAAAWLAGFPVANSVIPGDAPERFDFTGSSIDIGFRLCRFSSPRRFVISAELAYALTTLEAELAGDLRYLGREPMKGVLRGRSYPVFWIDMFASPDLPAFAKIELLEERVTGASPKPVKPAETREFLREWIASTGGGISLPFPPGKADPRFPIPENYDEQEAAKLSEFEREFLSESGIESNDGTDPDEDVFTDFTNRLKPPKKEP